MIHFATQLHAPSGHGTFIEGTRYYFSGFASDGTARLVWFLRGKHEWRVHLVHLHPTELEKRLLDGDLKVAERQHSLPPWLENVDGINFDEVESRRYQKRKRSAREQAQARLLKLNSALRMEEAILRAENPLRELSTLAAKLAVHPYRYQRDFFAFTLHGYMLWALKAPTQDIGAWKRDDPRHASRKFGRPSLNPRANFSWPLHLVREQCIDSYARRASIRKSMRAIYDEAIVQDFGCKIHKDQHGLRIVVHPENRPYPSIGQFRYAVRSEFGLDQIQRTRLGRTRKRNEAHANKGSFTQQYALALEGLSVDAYHVEERPTGLIHDGAGEALIVSRGTCSTTTACVGIGFSVGAERSEAYRAMLLSMALPKDYVAKLYGLPPELLEDWTAQGMSPSCLSDRGPGGSPTLVTNPADRFALKSIVPSHSGQSNALVEATHPRSVVDHEASCFLQSSATVVQLMKREILRAAVDNRSRDISNRLTDEQIKDFYAQGRPSTPNELWNYLCVRGRSAARQLSVEAAVRAYCTPHKFEIDRDGIRYRHHWFLANELTEGGLLEMLLRRGVRHVSGYYLSCVMRYVWIEVDGRLIEVEAQHRLRNDPDDLFVSVGDIDRSATTLATLKAITRDHARAAKAETRNDYKRVTGRRWDDAVVKRGSPPRARGDGVIEARVVKNGTTE